MDLTNEKVKTAVDELFKEDTPEGYYDTISKFYESYVGSHHCDGATAEQRIIVLMHFKAISRFLYRYKKAKKITKESETPWLI